MRGRDRVLCDIMTGLIASVATPPALHAPPDGGPQPAGGGRIGSKVPGGGLVGTQPIGGLRPESL